MTDHSHARLTVQPGLFDTEPPPSYAPDPEDIRKRLHDLLTTARNARQMPWDPQRERVNATLFHQMANWLPEQERDSLREAFAQELARLRTAE
jgi:hypothetical protein